MEYDFEVSNRLYAYIKILVPSKDMQQKNLIELPFIRVVVDSFGDNFVKESMKTTILGDTFKRFLNCVHI